MNSPAPPEVRILIAEDSRVISMVMSHALERAGFKVTVSQDGEECLTQAFTLRHDLIVLDIMMPKLHGIEVLKVLRGDPRTCDVPVLMCSAKDFKTEREAAARLGATDYLVKPQDPAVLVEKIEEILKLPHAGSRAVRSPAQSTEAYHPIINPSQPLVTLWGTRGSTPTPGGRFQRHGGNTSCMSLTCGDDLLIFDAGSGIRDLGLQLLKAGPRKLHLFITHTHWDHIQGFPFFLPAYHPDFAIKIYGSKGFGKDLEAIFRGQLDRDYFPAQLEEMHSSMSFHHLSEDPVQIGEATVTWGFAHHPLPTVGYKIQVAGRSIVWMPDNEFLQGYLGAPHELTRDHPKVAAFDQVLTFLANTDLLIHEAQYLPDQYQDKIGWGHSSVPNACALMKLASVRDWIVTHHDPLHDDSFLETKLQLTRQILDEIGATTNVIHGYDGMLIRV